MFIQKRYISLFVVSKIGSSIKTTFRETNANGNFVQWKPERKIQFGQDSWSEKNT